MLLCLFIFHWGKNFIVHLLISLFFYSFFVGHRKRKNSDTTNI
jgi:hypothetical protein